MASSQSLSAAAFNRPSPAKVIDVVEEGQEVDAEIHCLASFLSRDASFSFASIPPLDQVTVCSSEHDNDSVSSVSSDEDSCYEEASRCSHRSLFKNYWGKKGGAPAFSRPRPSRNDQETAPRITNDRQIDNDDDNESCGTYERTLKVNEAPPPATPRRRKIFSSSFVSEPSLNRVGLRREQLRKTKSSSALGKPCLRQSRFSLTSPPRQTSEPEAHVSFSSKVDVMVYQRPREVWAAKGWSDFFA